MSADFDKLAADFLEEQDDLVVDGDWLNDEERADLIVVDWAKHDELMGELARHLAEAAQDWWADAELALERSAPEAAES